MFCSKVVVWLDSGNNLEHGPVGPWMQSFGTRHSPLTRMYPTIQHYPKMGLSSSLGDKDLGDGPGQASNFAQTTSILDSNYGVGLDKNLMAVDIFYALNELWRLVAFAECQLLNMLKSKLDHETGITELLDQNHTLSNLLLISRTAFSLRQLQL